MSVFFPILHNVLTAIRQVQPVLIEATQTLGGKRWAIIRHVVFPATLPNLMTGIRLGIAFGLTPIYGADALWWSWPAGAGAAMLMAIAYYRHGGWRRLRMEEPPDAIEMTDAIIAESEPTGQMHPIANT